MHGSEFDVILPPQLADEYEVIACLKHGERRQTFLIRRISDGVRLVLKRSADKNEDLAAEYELLAQLRGEGIPEGIGFCSDAGVSFLLREYIPGQTLLDYMQKRGALPANEVISVMLAVCRIVKRLHGQTPPVIHRDIKAENIIRTQNGDIFLIDFGIARRYDPEIRQDTQVLGTPLYSPPEQYGYRQTDTRSDVYAMGVLMHELSTGESELGCGTADGAITGIVDRCTRFDPDDRYRDAEALERALKRLSSGGRRRFLQAAAVVAAIIVVLGAITVGVHAALARSKSGGGLSENTDTMQAETDNSADQTEYYTFASPEIEAEVCRMLSIEPGHVTYEDLALVDTLLLCGDTHFDVWDDNLLTYGDEIKIGGVTVDSKGSVATLEDIPNMPNLHTLALCNQEITDISPLRGCVIERLALHGNQISDLSPVCEVAGLYELVISGNPVEDISPLAECRLFRLNIGGTMVSDLRVLEEIGTLYRLEIVDCPLLSDISPLMTVSSLTALTIRPVSAEEFSVIRQMPQVKDLAMWQVEGFSDYSDLDALAELRWLFIDSPGLGSLEGLSQFDTLEFLDIRAHTEADIEPLTRFSALKNISFIGLYVTDWEPLRRIPALERVSCTADQYEQIKDMIGDMDIEIVVP